VARDTIWRNSGRKLAYVVSPQEGSMCARNKDKIDVKKKKEKKDGEEDVVPAEGGDAGEGECCVCGRKVGHRSWIGW